MTPDYLLYRMDIYQVTDCLELLRLEAQQKPVDNWLIVGGKQDLAALQRDRVAKVIRG